MSLNSALDLYVQDLLGQPLLPTTVVGATISRL